MVRKLNMWMLVPITLGIIFTILPYIAYVFVIPPFYTIDSCNTDSLAGNIYLNPGDEIILWPLNKTVEGKQKICRPDINYTLTFTLQSLIASGATQRMPINVTIFAAGVAVYQTSLSDQNNYRVTESINGTLPRFPGVWRFGLERPLEHGYDIYIKIINSGDEEARISFKFSGNVAYRQSMYVNVILFVFGIIILIGSIIQILYSIHQRKIEEKLRKMVSEET